MHIQCFMYHCVGKVDFALLVDVNKVHFMIHRKLIPPIGSLLSIFLYISSPSARALFNCSSNARALLAVLEQCSSNARAMLETSASLTARQSGAAANLIRIHADCCNVRYNVRMTAMTHCSTRVPFPVNTR